MIEVPRPAGRVRQPAGKSHSTPAVATPAAQPPAQSRQALAGREPSRAQIIEAFESAIEPVDLSVTYQLGILLVLAVMVILPLVYIALIGLVCYGVCWHAVYNVGTIGATGGGWRGVCMLLLYLIPLMAGGISVVFMVKPLFARPADQGRTRSLTLKSDPLLFAFVARVCEAVGAPEPKRINVDCNVNASAGFRRGYWSILVGDDLVLTIGLPLVAGLNLREFAGVLAHEFGHFTQGAGMRLTYIIRSISHWFTRVVYQRDQWDVRLEAWARKKDFRLGIVLHLARFCVWLTRRILWVLMVVGHAVSGFMLRQMEFDADRHQARLVGSDAFGPTSQKISLLWVAYQQAQTDLGEFRQEGRLGDNLPRLVIADVGRIAAGLVREIRKHDEEATTGLFDTHPATKDRIASAERECAPGVFRMECPATVLFSDFDSLSRNVTWDFYRAIFGPGFKATDMHPLDDLLARQSTELEAGKALERYFQGEFHSLRPLPLPGAHATAPSHPRRTAADLKEARKRMLQTRAAYAHAYPAYVQSDTQAVEADQAEALLTAGFNIRPDAFSVPLSSPLATRKARTDALCRQQETGRQLADFEEAAGRRLFAALQLLHVPQVARQIEDAPHRRRLCNRWLTVLAMLKRQHSPLLELRNTHATL
ncbi:MAG: M48 family metallopeptidase, partial [Planctomycetota bacterium]